MRWFLMKKLDCKTLGAEIKYNQTTNESSKSGIFTDILSDENLHYQNPISTFYYLNSLNTLLFFLLEIRISLKRNVTWKCPNPCRGSLNSYIVIQSPTRLCMLTMFHFYNKILKVYPNIIFPVKVRVD